MVDLDTMDAPVVCIEEEWGNGLSQWKRDRAEDYDIILLKDNKTEWGDNFLYAHTILPN